jgi:hypothetical protein
MAARPPNNTVALALGAVAQWVAPVAAGGLSSGDLAALLTAATELSSAAGQALAARQAQEAAGRIARKVRARAEGGQGNM